MGLGQLNNRACGQTLKESARLAGTVEKKRHFWHRTVGAEESQESVEEGVLLWGMGGLFRVVETSSRNSEYYSVSHIIIP